MTVRNVAGGASIGKWRERAEGGPVEEEEFRGMGTVVQVSHVVAEGGVDRETHVPERGEYTGNASRGVTSGGGRVYGEWRVILRRMFATPSLAIGIKNEETLTTRVYGQFL